MFSTCYMGKLHALDHSRQLKLLDRSNPWGTHHSRTFPSSKPSSTSPAPVLPLQASLKGKVSPCMICFGLSGDLIQPQQQATLLD